MGSVGQLVVGFVLIFGSAKVALADPKEAIPAVRDLKVSDIVIPSELGYVVETHQPPDNPHSSIIVHIQEAHTNFEAQTHIASILERLIEQHGLRLILVEGGQGDVGLSYLRSYGSPENRRQVAEKYLKLGVLSAEEYLDIVSDYPLVLWGVEQKDLYDQHVGVFVDAESLQESLKPVLASVRQAVETLKPRLFDAALIGLEAKAKAFEQEELGLADYADVLASLANRQGISEKEYPNLARFLYVRQLEHMIRLEQVQQEQQALIERLNFRLNDKELDELIAKAHQLKAGTIKREEFYERLEALAVTSGLDLGRYPNLSRYIRYVERSAHIKPTMLADELEQLAARLREGLALTPQSQQLQALAAQLDLIEKLLELRLSPQEYQRMKSLEVEGLFSSWRDFLNEQLLAQGLPTSPFPRLDALEQALPTLRRFYEAALGRDEVLVENALEKLAQTKERLAVLITGGFHSPKITTLLRDRGLGVVVVTPKVTQATDERLYHAVLKYKSGHGSFEEVVAVANSNR